MNTLYMMVGLPGSGKSTWAHKFIKTYTDRIVYISRDAIRMTFLSPTDSYFSHEDDVFDKWAETIATNLKYGNDVIADATHTSHGARAKLLRALSDHGVFPSEYEIVFVVMRTSVDECVARDALREGRQHVTEEVIRNWARTTTVPALGEFENVKEVLFVE